VHTKLQLLRGIATLMALMGACAVDGREPTDSSSASQSYRVVNRFPHDTGAYTQGLFFPNGKLYEGTGLVGESSIREVDLPTGRVLRSTDLDGEHFGEGIALVNNRLYQLTWQSGIALVYDVQTFAVLDTIEYQGEGWGLTWDGQSLIMSDGTPTLRFRDPHDFRVIRSIEVRDKNVPLKELNELEFVNGEILANVYRTDYIVRIDPNSGNVLGWIDLKGLLRPEEKTGNVDVLNGIAWDAATQRLFVTGKRWPALFEIVVQTNPR
jgi:glutamine cyclotransferase